MMTKDQRAGVLGWAMLIVAIFAAAGQARCQSFEMGAVYWPQATALASISTEKEAGEVQAPATFRITASRQPISVLRAITHERPPEAAGVYSVRVCNVSRGDAVIDGGEVEQRIEGRGVAIIPRALTEIAVKRARKRGVTVLAKVGEVALIAAPMVLGAAAGGVIQLNGWQSGVVAAVGTGLNIIGSAAKPELETITGDIDPLGIWLSDQRRIALKAGECSARMLTMGSYRAGMPQVLVIEVGE